MQSKLPFHDSMEYKFISELILLHFCGSCKCWNSHCVLSPLSEIPLDIDMIMNMALFLSKYSCRCYEQ